jgi:methylamine dehydrogenase accessory protein MauD
MTGWMLGSYIVLWVLVLALGGLCAVLLRQIGLVYLRLDEQVKPLGEGPDIGTRLAEFVEQDEIAGAAYRVPDEDAVGTLLLLVSPYCAICEETIQGVVASDVPDRVAIVFISDGTPEETEPYRALVRAPARFTTSGQRQESFGAQLIPYGFVLDRDGQVLAKQTVNGPREVAQLMQSLDEALISNAVR